MKGKKYKDCFELSYYNIANSPLDEILIKQAVELKCLEADIQIQKSISMKLEQAREKTENMNSESLAKSYCYKTNEIKRLKEKIEKLNFKRCWSFDCWNRYGEMQTIDIEALSEENATIIFKHEHPDLGFDPPY